jgi:hypothetical protein
MEEIIIEATKSSPSVRGDSEGRVLEIAGKSYPENAARFFAPIMDWVAEALSAAGASMDLNIELIYLNSSSSKALFNLFEALERSAAQGARIVVNWRYHQDNDTALECGEEFKEDLSSLTFNLVEINDG